MTEELTDKDLATIEARLAKATPDFYVTSSFAEKPHKKRVDGNTDLINHCYDDIRRLLAEVKRFRIEREEFNRG